MEENKHAAAAASVDQRLGTAPLVPLIFSLALPTALAQLVNMLYNIVDRIYVGHIPGSGSLALAGLGVTYPIIVLITAFSNLIGMGGAPRASVAMGRGDYKTAEKILGNCITLLIVLSVVLSVVFTIYGEPVLRAFGASENTLPYAMAYLRIYLMGTIFVQFTLGMTPFITNQGFAKTSMATTCIGAVCNIVLDPVFIYGFNMGVEGAAIATILSQAVSAVWVLIFFTGKRSVLRIRKENLIPAGRTLALVLSLGVSPFLMTATECVIQLAFNTGAATYGGDSAVAIMSILFSVAQIANLPVQGFCQGAQPVVGFNFGARKMERVRQAFKIMLAVSMGVTTVVVGAGLFLHGRAAGLPADLPRPWRSQDQHVHRPAAQGDPAAAPLPRHPAGVRRAGPQPAGGPLCGRTGQRHHLGIHLHHPLLRHRVEEAEIHHLKEVPCWRNISLSFSSPWSRSSSCGEPSPSGWVWGWTSCLPISWPSWATWSRCRSSICSPASS